MSEPERSPLPFPGKTIDGVCEVVFFDLNKLPRERLRDLCDDLHPRKTGDRATLTARLTKFNAGRIELDGLHAGARNDHSGSRASIVMTQHSTRRHELNGPANGIIGPTINPERREDLCTDEEKDKVLAWARRCAASHPYRGPPPSRSEHESSHPTRQSAQQRELLSINVNGMTGSTRAKVFHWRPGGSAHGRGESSGAVGVDSPLPCP